MEDCVANNNNEYIMFSILAGGVLGEGVTTQGKHEDDGVGQLASLVGLVHQELHLFDDHYYTDYHSGAGKDYTAKLLF